jgi:hypothetical protein
MRGDGTHPSQRIIRGADPTEQELLNDGWMLDEYGNAWGYCNACGEEVLSTGVCCMEGEIVPG